MHLLKYSEFKEVKYNGRMKSVNVVVTGSNHDQWKKNLTKTDAKTSSCCTNQEVIDKVCDAVASEPTQIAHLEVG